MDNDVLQQYRNFLKDTIPTMENLVYTFWEILKDKIPEGELFEIRLHESDENFVVYRGE